MGTYDTRGGAPLHDAAADCDAFGNRSTFIAQCWTELDGWIDTDHEFDIEDDAVQFIVAGNERAGAQVWRYYDALEAHYAEVEKEMEREAEWASERTPECGCEWGCWRCEGEG